MNSYKNPNFQLFGIDKNSGMVYNKKARLFSLLCMIWIHKKSGKQEAKMAKNEERYVNVTLKSDPGEEKDEIIISFSALFKVLKRFLLIWIVIALIVGICIPVYYAAFPSAEHKTLSAVVRFSFDGIEEGKAPDGSLFNVNTMKSSIVVEKALKELGESTDKVEAIRQSITISGQVPENAYNKLTGLQSIYEQGNLAALQEMLNTNYSPTQFMITFNYSASGLSGEKAVTVLNTILDCYRDYFFETYGFNQALGSAVTVLDYKDYDYAQAIDVFKDSLNTLENYITNLSVEDTTRFRSIETGYTFADLTQAIQTVRDVNLDQIDSYVAYNNVTKDKNNLIDYYNYRIETLSRERTVAEETLKSLNESIQNYVKDTIVVYGGDAQESAQYTQASEEYDRLVAQKITAQNNLSTKLQAIKECQSRLNSLKVNNAASQEKMERVETDMAALNEKINELLQLTNTTANEYYTTVYLADAYSILAPASTSSLVSTTSMIKHAMKPTLIAEAILFVLYIGTAFVVSLVEENRKRKFVPAAAAPEDEDEADEAEDKTDATEEA